VGSHRDSPKVIFRRSGASKEGGTRGGSFTSFTNALKKNVTIKMPEGDNHTTVVPPLVNI
jgi:hypothetical protein